MKKIDRRAIWLDVLGLFLAGLNNTFFALLVAIFIHGPGTTSGQPDLLLRAVWIVENPLLWKAGWFFWFIPTLTFAWSYFAIGRHLDEVRPWRDLAIGVAIIAAAVDIVGVLVNLSVLPALAGELTNSPATFQVVFLSLERLANNLTNIGGFGLYSLAGILLLPAVFATPGFPRLLTWIGVAEWGMSIFAAGLLIVAPGMATVPLLISFLLFAPWVWGCAWWLWHRSEK